MAREVTSRRPTRGAAYHESAITYNEGMAKRARELSAEVPDDEVKRWCRSVARQHDEHAVFHRKSLVRIQKQKERKKKQRNNKNRPKTPTVDEHSEEKKEAPSRPIPRDPRALKTVFANNPVDREAVETDVTPRLRDTVVDTDAYTNGPVEDSTEEKQEKTA